MKNSVMTLLSAVLPQLLAAQTASQNYILSRRPLDASGKTAIETVTYIDGLGRPVETVQKGVAPDGGDIVSIKEYDGLDREVRSWLPVSIGTGGGYVSPQAFKQSAVGSDVYGGDAFPYSENVYELSALGRVVRQHGPGKAWRDAGSHTDTEFYANCVNDDTLACLDYRVGDNGLLVCRGECPAGSLYVTKTTDEDGGISYEFTDAVCNDNPMKYIDDDGNIVKTFHLWNNDAKTCTFYRSPSDFKSAMMKFARTSYGNQLLADFTPKGSSVFGAKGNGKCSDFTLKIQEMSFTDGGIRGAVFGVNPEILAQTQIKKGQDGKPTFTVIFNLSFFEDDYVETIVHEFAVHLAKYKDVIETYKQTGSYEESLKIWKKTSGEEEHHDMINKNTKRLNGSKIYDKTKNEMVKLFPFLKTKFEERNAYYKDNY